MPSVLVIDDDANLNRFISRSLSRQGFECTSALDGRSAMEILGKQRFDAIVCDLRMPDVDGLEVLRASTQLEPAPPFIMITAYGNVHVAVRAMHAGAADFLEKPVGVDELRACILGALNRRREVPPRIEQPKPSAATTRLVGSKRWLEPFSKLLRRIAATDTVVLLEGETGTGKSAVAREIWRASRRAAEPYVELNCGALPDNLVERELFGNEKGAYTGADEAHQGKVSQAENGTLFLDEIGELPLLLQPKLLHLLSERTYQPLGSTESRKANVRFIAATNKDLQQAIEDSGFRPDLYYRLNVMSLTIPPLRERTDDVVVLIDHFRDDVAKRVGRPCPKFSAPALQALQRYAWPGNVRELENLVEKMAIMVDEDEVEVSDLPAPYQRASKTPNDASGAPKASTEAPQGITPQLQPEVDMDLKNAVTAYERALIIDALRQEDGNRTKAARRLHLKRTTLIEKISRFSIESDEYEPDSDD